jgi:RNA polymerase-binding transcription factor DksA
MGFSVAGWSGDPDTVVLPGARVATLTDPPVAHVEVPMPSKTTAKPTPAEQRKRLEALRDEVKARIERNQEDYDALAALGEDVGASEEEGGGESDGTFVERDRLRASAEADEDLLEAIEAAYERVGQSGWRNCSRCGGEIGEHRLEALPTTDLCVSCKASSRGW